MSDDTRAEELKRLLLAEMNRVHALSAENVRLRAALEKAAPHVCSNLCPSTWRTVGGRPPCSAECQEIAAALASAGAGR